MKLKNSEEPGMRVAINEMESIAVASVDSSILQENVPMLRDRLAQLLDEKHVWIVMDLSKANYLSSMGVAVIVDLKLKANKAGGDVKLACVNQLIRSLLDITNVSRRMEIFVTVENALTAIKKEIEQKDPGVSG
jgi:anti-anti-sigma factor